LSTKDALEQYTDSARDLAIFDSVYRDVLETRTMLQKAADERLAELKSEARKSGEEVENRYFGVKVVTKSRRFYNANILIREFPAVTELTGVILQTVDKELAEHYLKVGIIPEEAGQAAEVVEPMTSAVSLRTKSKFGKPVAKVRAEIRSKTER
jgi:hypothetical protein